MRFYPQKLQGESLTVTDNTEVRYTRTGSIIRYSIQTGRNRENHIKRLGNGLYMDDRTGEVKEIKFRAKTRKDNIKNVKASLQNGRDLINANITDLKKVAWVTFTYAENMTDTKKLYNDWNNFNRFYRKKVGNYEYIIAVEPQRRGAWHMHSFLIFENDVYLDYNVIRETWGKGRVEVQYMYGNVDNLGAYLSAYLCNLELDEKARTLGYHDLDVVKCDRTGHMYEKGQRLGMYPRNMKIFRKSKGIIKPESEWKELKDAEKEINALGATKTFESYYERDLETKSGTKTQIIYNQYFNIKK